MLDAHSESLLRFQFGSAETMHGGSTSGHLLERAALYRVPKPAAKRTKAGKLIRDADLDDVRKQWNAFRKRAGAFALGRETLVAFWGWCLAERPWKTHETLPRLAAAYAELDRLYAEWEAGALPSEVGLRRWLRDDVLPLKAGQVAPEITARPTAETKASNATEPAHRDLLRAAAAGRVLQRMGRAGRLAEVDALGIMYGAAGQHFLDQGLPRHWALATMTREGAALLARLPKSGALARWYEQWGNHWHARDSATYAAFAEDFAALELACDRLEARACRAWQVAREATGGV